MKNKNNTMLLTMILMFYLSGLMVYLTIREPSLELIDSNN